MIKQIDEIPKSLNEQRQSRRQMIRADIQEAIDRGITKFEFEGDYNYKYLRQYAAEEANHVKEKSLREAWRSTHEPNDKGWWPMSPHYYDRHIRDITYISIHNVKMPDRNHVYCEIFPEAIDKMIEAHEKYIAEHEQRDAEREKAKKEKEEAKNGKDIA